MTELKPRPVKVGGAAAWTFDNGPAVGDEAPAWALPDAGFRMWSNDEFKGRPVVLATLPTVETPAGKETLDALASWARETPGTEFLAISVDVPFALAGALDELRPPENMRLLSAFRSPEFGMEWGMLLVEHPMMGLLARAVFVSGADGRILHVEVAAEVLDQPDWKKAKEALE
ncbi:MAG: redoxin domain-containing protein [Kiritimatiellae bacterium]|nr:redoxin domain-containing protein [Kiritimatiellia bacterium]